MKNFKVALRVLPFLIMGLWFTFGVPGYLKNAPAFYYQLPIPVPPQYWAPLAQIIGIGLLIVAVIIVLLSFNSKPTVSNKEKVIKDRSKLLVLMQHDDIDLLDRTDEGLKQLRQEVKSNLGIDVSFLRGGYQTCKVWLLDYHDRRAIVIIDFSIYCDPELRDALFNRGAELVFCFSMNDTSADALVSKTRSAIYRTLINQ